MNRPAIGAEGVVTLGDWMFVAIALPLRAPSIVLPWMSVVRIDRAVELIRPQRWRVVATARSLVSPAGDPGWRTMPRDVAETQEEAHV